MNATHSSSSTANTHQTTNSTCQEPLPCPRCNSHDTKFCYYNNYNLAQPRHYCRACRRYWTHGGTLRNVPVGGGCRKNKQVSTDPTQFRLTPSSATTPFTVWNPNANSNTSLPVLNSQVPDMAHNGFQLIPSEAVPTQPFQVDMPDFGIDEMNQFVGDYTSNVDTFGDAYESYDSNVEFGSVLGVIPINNGSEYGYWNPGSAWTDYPATNSAFH